MVEDVLRCVNACLLVNVCLLLLLLFVFLLAALSERKKDVYKLFSDLHTQHSLGYIA